MTRAYAASLPQTSQRIKLTSLSPVTGERHDTAASTRFPSVKTTPSCEARALRSSLLVSRDVFDAPSLRHLETCDLEEREQNKILSRMQKNTCRITGGEMLISIRTLITEIYISSAHCNAPRPLKRKRLRAGKNKVTPTDVMKRGTRVSHEDARRVPILFLRFKHALVHFPSPFSFWPNRLWVGVPIL